MFCHLIKSSNFFRIAYPHIKLTYFQEAGDKLLFKKIKDYQEKYNKIPSFADLKLTIDTDVDISIEDTTALKSKLNDLRKCDLVSDEKLLLDSVEEWCQNRAIELATYDFIESLEGGKADKGTKIEKIKEAMGIQFVVDV